MSSTVITISVKKRNNMEKLKNKSTKAGNDLVKLFMLLVVLSGIYAVYVVAAGTEGLIPKLMVAPLALWLAVRLIQQFNK